MHKKDDNMVMRYFLDTEFIEDGKTIDLISIGLVWDNGEYYAISSECDYSKANDWVKENVLKDMPARSEREDLYKTRSEIAKDIIQIVEKNSNEGRPAFYGWYSDYDWVVFCQLFGRMVDLPKGFPMYCRDIKQMADELGNPRMPKQDTGKHNALEDARWNKKAYEYIQELRYNAYDGRDY